MTVKGSIFRDSFYSRDWGKTENSPTKMYISSRAFKNKRWFWFPHFTSRFAEILALRITGKSEKQLKIATARRRHWPTFSSWYRGLDFMLDFFNSTPRFQKFQGFFSYVQSSSICPKLIFEYQAKKVQNNRINEC